MIGCRAGCRLEAARYQRLKNKGYSFRRRPEAITPRSSGAIRREEGSTVKIRGTVFGYSMLALVAVALCSGPAMAEKRIAVVVWNDEARYADSKNGILEQLRKDGFAEPKVKFTDENAGGNKAKAAEIAQKIATSKPDLVIAVGTSAAVAAANTIKDIPIVFSMFYDPVDAKVAASWASSGNNTTGASSKVPMAKLVGTLKQLAPVKRLAVLYTPGEKNSETQLKEVQAVQGDAQIKVTPVPLTSKADVAAVMPQVTGSADAVYLTGSGIVGEALPAIVDEASKAKVITVTHLEDHVEKGVLLGVTASPHALGVLAGQKAAKVLKGAKPSTIPIETLKKFDVIVNMKTTKATQIQVPAGFLKNATRVIE